jgi:hypothetical protein
MWDPTTKKVHRTSSVRFAHFDRQLLEVPTTSPEVSGGDEYVNINVPTIRDFPVTSPNNLPDLGVESQRTLLQDDDLLNGV